MFNQTNATGGEKMKKQFVFGALLTGLFLFVGGQTFAGVTPVQKAVTKGPMPAIIVKDAVKNPVPLNNLLINGDFENGFNSWLDAGPGWGIQSDIVHGGTRAALNTIGTIPGNDYFASLAQTYNLSAGQTVYATLWARTAIDVRSPAVAGLLIEFFRSDNALLSKKQSVIGGQTDWRQLYVSATAPAGTAKIKYTAFVYAAQGDTNSVSGAAYFDDAVLSTDPIAPPAAQTAVINPGFENGIHDWNILYQAGQPQVVVDNQNPFEGLYSTKFTISASPNQDFFSSASQDLAYQGGAVYAAAHVKTNMNPSSTATAGLLLEFYDASGIRVGSTQQVLNGANGWTRLVINGFTPASTTTTVRVYVFTYAARNDGNAVGGTANFDNLIFSYNPLPGEYRTTLLNNGFENGLSNWSELFGFPATVSTTAHSGSFSAKKTVGVIPGSDYYSQIYQDIYYNSSGNPYPDNTIVYATGYVKTNMNPVTKSQAGIQFEFINANGQVIRDGNNQPITFKNFVGGQTDWRQVYAAIGTPAGTVRVRVSGIIFARRAEAVQAGDAYFDDFQFSLSYLPGVRLREQLYNGGFENGINDWDEFNNPAEVSASVKRTGNYAGMFNFPLTLTTDYFGSMSQDIRVYPRWMGTARFSAWVKTNMANAVFSSASISIQYLDGGKNPVSPLYTSALIRGTQDWTQLSVIGTIPSNAIIARVSCNVFAPVGETGLGQRVYFDDAYFTSKGIVVFATEKPLGTGTGKIKKIPSTR